MQTEGVLASRLADFAICGGGSHPDVINEGAATVLFEQLPATRKLDGSIHGGKILVGAERVFIGGPTFALPANITIRGTAEFQNKVVRDLYFLSTTRTGREVLRRLEASGQPVVIIERAKGEGSDTFPFDVIQPCGTLIRYDVDTPSGLRGSSPGDGPAGHMIPGPPQVALGHELIHALHNAEDTRGSVFQDDPNGPPTEPLIDEEESKTMGTGSHQRDFPTENTLRDDLGLPRRIDHTGTRPGRVPPFSLRPGG